METYIAFNKNMTKTKRRSDFRMETPENTMPAVEAWSQLQWLKILNSGISAQVSFRKLDIMHSS